MVFDREVTVKIMRKDPRPYRLLVVEDNPGDLVLLEDYLDEHMLHPVLTICTTGKSAKEALQSTEDPFDLILLDLSLPDDGGESLIRHIVELAHLTPVVALTGFTDMDFSIRSLSMGVSDYLLKDELTATTLYKSILYNIERSKNLNNLLESEKRYSDLFHLSPSPMFLFDLESLNFLSVNKAAVAAYGYSQDEFLRMNLHDIRPAEDIPHLHQTLSDATDEKAHEFNNIRHKRKDGTIFYVNLRGSNFDYKNRKARLMMVNDITEQMKYIQTIEDQNKNLREIAWTQSHVVRAPLARLLSIIELERHEQPAANREYSTLIKEAAEELDEVIQTIVKKTQTMNI